MGDKLNRYMELKGIKEKADKNKADISAELDKATTVAQVKNVLKKLFK